MADCDESNIIFIDTTLHTHLALHLSHKDTIFHLKDRILVEHQLCFPHIGQIQIHALKVRRKGCFYHLPDSMFVKSAFNGVNKNWFLTVDASPLVENGQHQQLLLSSASPNKVACVPITKNALLGPVDNAMDISPNGVSGLNYPPLPQLENNVKELVPLASLGVSEHTGKEVITNLRTDVKSSGNNDPGIPLLSSISETEDHHHVNNEHPSLQIECEEGHSISVASIKKQRKSKRKKEDTERDHISKENIVSVDNPLSVSSKTVTRSKNLEVSQVKNKLDEREKNHFGSSNLVIPSPSSVPAEDHVCDGYPSISVPSSKKKRKNKKKKEVDSSTEHIASVDNALRDQSKRVPSFNNIQTPQRENKKDEKVESHFASSCVSKITGKVVKKLGKGVKSSTNNDTGIPLFGSTPETENHHNVNKEIPSKVDGSSEGTIKNGFNVHEEDPLTPMLSVKEKRRSKRIKENIVQDDTSKENNDNPLSVPSKKVSSLKSFRVSKLESKEDEKEGIDIVDESVKEASTAGPAANKKRNKRNRSSSHDSKDILQLEIAQKDEARKPDEAHKQSKESKDQLECNNDKTRGEAQSKHNKITDDFSDTRPPAKKRKKGKDKSTPGIDLNMNKSTINNMEIGTDALKESIGSKVHPSDVLSSLTGQVIGPKELTEDNVNIVIDHSHKSDAGQSEGAEEVREGSAQNAPKPMLLEEIFPSNQDNTCANVRESNDISKVVDENGMAEPVKSEKKKRGTRKAKDSGGEPSLGESTGLVDASDKCDAGQSKGAEEVREGSPQNAPKPMLLEESFPSSQVNTSANVRESNDISKVVDENVITEPVKSEKKKRGTRKAKDSGRETSLGEGTGLVDASDKCDAGQSKGAEEVREGSPQNAPKSMLLEESFPSNQVNTGANVRESNDISKVVDENVMAEPVKSEKKKREIRKAKDSGGEPSLGEGSGLVDVSDISDVAQSEGAEEVREGSLQNAPKATLLEESLPSKQNNTSANLIESNDISKVVGENQMAEPAKSEKKKRGTRKAKDSGGEPPLSVGTGLVDASDNGNFFRQFFKATNCNPKSGSTEIEEKPSSQTEEGKKQEEEMKGSAIPATGKEDDLSADNAGSLDNAEGVDEHVDNRQRKKSNNNETSIANNISNHAMPSIEENRTPHVDASGKSKNLEKQREHIPLSNLKIEGSKKKVQNKTEKAYGLNVGGVLSNTQQKKSLLEGAIFKEDSSGTSEDESGVDSSDASTKTPSDSSLLSDFSDADSNDGLDSQQSGLYGGRSALKDGMSGTKLAIDHVLRSSRRYKKAKIMASQTESQLEFVPDSLAD